GGERVAGRAAGRPDEDGHVAQRVLVDDVDEGLEQPGVASGEDRSDGDETIGAGHRLERLPEVAGGEPGEPGGGDLVGEVAQLVGGDLGGDAALTELGGGGLREAVGEQPGRGRLAEAGGDDGDLSGAHGVLLRWGGLGGQRPNAAPRVAVCAASSSAVRPVQRSSPATCWSWTLPSARALATRSAWLGGSEGTCAGRLASNSLRSAGTISSARMSICSRTVWSGSPAWSMRNIWRW